jgi:uncharacterized protein
MWLALFGLLHGTLIWGGDILLSYALCALLVLFPFRHLPARRLIMLGFALWVVGGTFGAAQFVKAQQTITEARLVTEALAEVQAGRPLTPVQTDLLTKQDKEREDGPAELAKEIAEGRADYLDYVSLHAGHYIDFLGRYLRSGFALEIIGAMFLGMGLYKAGFLSGRLAGGVYLRTALIGYAVVVPIVLVGLWNANLDGFSKVAVTIWVYLPYCAQNCAGTLANASMLLFIAHKGWLQPVTRRLRAIGRTAFSNYILTSLLCQFVFAWGPWKLYGKLDYYQYLYVVFAVWVLNLFISPLWLRYFTFGPLEWAWRSLTYWHRPALARSSELLRSA